jgi:lambda family phage tail tape measure protein
MEMATEVDTLVINVKADTVQFRNAIREATSQATSFSTAISRAFKDAVVGGKSFEDVLKNLALRLAGLALDRALQPLSNRLGDVVSGLFSAFGLANGGVVAGGAVKPFATGGVVSSPTLFPLANGLGLMGEAGPEAVLPLARGSDGALGVRSGTVAPISVTLNVTATDAESFRKSEAQVTAMLARAVARGRRGL